MYFCYFLLVILRSLQSFFSVVPCLFPTQCKKNCKAMTTVSVMAKTKIQLDNANLRHPISHYVLHSDTWSEPLLSEHPVTRNVLIGEESISVLPSRMWAEGAHISQRGCGRYGGGRERKRKLQKETELKHLSWLNALFCSFPAYTGVVIRSHYYSLFH